MTNTYSTGNALGSSAPKDLFDNASNFDEFMNSTAPSALDRFNRTRQTWAGAEYEWQQFLINSGYEPVHLTYVDGSPLVVSRPTQLIDRAGFSYRIKTPQTFPYTLTGTWATDQNNVVEVGDSPLRQQLAASTGATLIGVTGYANLQANLDALAAGEFVTPEKHGAVGDGVADDTLAVQAAVNDAQDNGGFLLLRRKYRVTSTIQQTKRLRVQGTGSFNSQIIFAGTGDAWVCTVPYGGTNNNNGYQFMNFGIVPTVAGAGQYGLRVKLQLANPGVTVCFFADGLFSDLYIGDFGSEGLYLDNSVGNTDGFFTSRLQFCSITNGIKGVNLGDSLTFAHSKIFGRLCGMNIIGVPGARQMILNDLNITTSGGAIALQGVEEPTIMDCQLEHPGYLSGYTGVFGAFVLLFNCYKAELLGNTINPDNGAATAPSNPGLVATAVAMTGTSSYTLIDRNDIQKGSIDHIATANSAVSDTTIGEFNTYYGASAPVISDAGTRTKFPTVRGSLAYAATVANGTQTGQSLSVPGARVGQYVQASYSNGSGGALMHGWVSSAGVVQVAIRNDSGAPVTFSGGNITVKVSS